MIYYRKKQKRATWLTQAVEHVTIDLQVISLSPHWAYCLLEKKKKKAEEGRRKRERRRNRDKEKGGRREKENEHNF